MNLIVKSSLIDWSLNYWIGPKDSTFTLAVICDSTAIALLWTTMRKFTRWVFKAFGFLKVVFEVMSGNGFEAFPIRLVYRRRLHLNCFQNLAMKHFYLLYLIRPKLTILLALELVLAKFVEVGACFIFRLRKVTGQAATYISL